MGVQEKFSNPLRDFTINTLKDVEEEALKLRDAWELGLAPISNLLEILEENVIRVHEVQNIDDFDGLSARVGDFHVIVIK